MATIEHPIFAALYDRLNAPCERKLMPSLRRELLAGCRGDALEIGVGTGASFPVWKEILEDRKEPSEGAEGRRDGGAPGSGSILRLTGAEPDPHMLRRARRRAAALGLPIRLIEAPAESLPFPDASFDFAVTSLVLCTVADPAAAVREIARVLRPGGELRFLEHVRVEGLRGALQERATPLWSRLAGGCQLNRPIGEWLQATFPYATWRELPVPFPACRLILGRAVQRPQLGRQRG